MALRQEVILCGSVLIILSRGTGSFNRNFVNKAQRTAINSEHHEYIKIDRIGLDLLSSERSMKTLLQEIFNSANKTLY